MRIYRNFYNLQVKKKKKEQERREDRLISTFIQMYAYRLIFSIVSFITDIHARYLQTNSVHRLTNGAINIISFYLDLHKLK